jgi:hypothetical protein
MKKAILADLIDMTKPSVVLDEVRKLYLSVYPSEHFHLIEDAFKSMRILYQGKYEGYSECNTDFHDFQHAMDCFMAMARLLHGAEVGGTRFDAKNAALGLITAIMHDTGYIPQEGEIGGTGARFSRTHTFRSSQFLKKYFAENGFTDEDYRFGNACIQCTGIYLNMEVIPFVSEENRTLGQMLGTADLLGQMANRTYLEKLLLLYREFKEASFSHFEDELDLLKKTRDFYKSTRELLAKDLGGVEKYMAAHFKSRWKIKRDLYRESIEKQLLYLDDILLHREEDYLKHLKRRPVSGNLSEDD